MRVVAAADEWSGLDMAKAHAQRFGLKLGEFTGCVEPGHGQVVARGTQVLADREDVASDCGEVAEDSEQFMCLFAEADHHSRFRHASWVEFFGVAEELEGALVASARAHGTVKARDGLGIVIQDFGSGVDDDSDCFPIALKVGDEDFDAASRSLTTDFVDHHGEDAGASDEIVVAIHTGNDGVFEAECGDGFGNATGLVIIDGLGAALWNGAESAAAGAEVAEHHESGRLVTPALADIGALGAFADSVEAERAGQLLEGVVVFADGSTGLEPLWLGSGSAAGGLDLDEVHL